MFHPNFTIGADVEVFGKLPGQDFHKSLCGLIGGTKDKPKQLQHLNDGYMVQEDNVSLEYNIPVCSSKEEFISSIRTMRNECHNILNSFSFELSPNSSFSFDNEELRHPNAMVFGCEPDFNAWKRTENSKPIAKDKNLRTCGGHIHIGTNEVDMIEGIQYMDLFLGVPSILVDNSPSSAKRRELYGKAGAMRPKPYGFEYRVLSNFWMFEDRLVDWIYQQTRTALAYSTDKRLVTSEKAKLIQKAINNNDEQIAKKLIDEFGMSLPMSSEEWKKQLEEEETIHKQRYAEALAKIRRKKVLLSELVSQYEAGHLQPTVNPFLQGATLPTAVQQNMYTWADNPFSPVSSD